jgi:hypothetical protein
MTRVKSHLTLAGMMGSDSEEDQLGLCTSGEKQSGTSKTTAAKKARGRPAANKVTKPKQTSTRRASGRIATGIRQALEDRTNNSNTKISSKGNGGITETASTLQDFNHEREKEDLPRPKPKARGRGRPKAETAHNQRSTSNPQVPSSTLKPAVIQSVGRESRRAITRPYATLDHEIPETQMDTMDMDDSELQNAEDSMEVDEFPQLPIDKLPKAIARAAKPQAPASPGPKTNEAAIRRRLGELASKYESLELRYRDLQNIGVKEAERNFDRLRKQGDERLNGII